MLAVNPKYQAVEGIPCHADIASLPLIPDLAVISTPPETVPGSSRRSGGRARGPRSSSPPVSERAGRAAGRSSSRPCSMPRGPSSSASSARTASVSWSPASGSTRASPISTRYRAGLAFVAQSGAIVTSVMDWARARGIGFSHLVSLGDMADVDFGDLLDYLASDAETRAILLYIEAVTEARKFMSAARAAARMKPIIVVKAGRHAEGARAAASHTGALAGSDAVYEAVFRRAGMLRVYSLDELFDAAEILATAPRAKGPRMAILTQRRRPRRPRDRRPD